VDKSRLCPQAEIHDGEARAFVHRFAQDCAAFVSFAPPLRAMAKAAKQSLESNRRFIN
jgi:hypothetical protein